MKKIAIFQSNLNVGGIQKSLINLISNIDTTKYEIDLYLFSKTNFFCSDLLKKVNVTYLKSNSIFSKFIYFDLYKIFKKYKFNKVYDIAIDFDSYQHATALAAIQTKAKKKIMWIHNDVEQKIKEEFKYKLLHYFFKGKYKYFDTFVAVSDGIIEPFQKAQKIYNKRFLTIPNYINTTEIVNKSIEKVDDIIIDANYYNLVSVGRLCHQKGFDILINYMEQILKQRNDIKLYIIGDGDKKEEIQNLIKSKKLENNIFLLGNKTNPFKYLKLMDGFILTSRYEGQGMVILEAKTLGLDIFITKNLEKYNQGIPGCSNIVSSVVNTKKNNNKIIDYLENYNNDITNRLYKLFDEK